MIGGVGGDSGESEGRTVRVFGWETETAVWCGDLVIVGGTGTGLVGGEEEVRWKELRRQAWEELDWKSRSG